MTSLSFLPRPLAAVFPLTQNVEQEIFVALSDIPVGAKLLKWEIKGMDLWLWLSLSPVAPPYCMPMSPSVCEKAKAGKGCLRTVNELGEPRDSWALSLAA
jgi:hypothetical protein